MYRKHTHCRACNSADLTPVFNLGIQPLANDFCGPHDEHAGYAPLEVLFCSECSLAQLSVVVRPEVMFSKYAYVTSTSLTMERHFAVLYQDIIGQQGVPNEVLEIGSNDGRFLRFLKDRGASAVLGVDPAVNLAAEANARGIPTLAKEFNIATAEQVKTLMQFPDVIIARHVLSHCGNWHDFIAALQIIAGPKTLIVIEVPDAEKMLHNVEFHQIYHEHASYLTIKAARALLAGTNLEIDQVGHYAIHGGAIALFLRRKDSRHTASNATDNIAREDWRQFSLKAHERIEWLHTTVTARVLQGKKVVGFGAAAKATVWLNACRFTQKEIAFVTDNTPIKQGKTIPGTDIPVVPEAELLNDGVDYSVLWAWGYRDEILEGQKVFRQRGGKFIIPLPTPEIV